MTAAVHALHHPEPLPLASRKDLLGVGEADPATGIRHSLPALHGLLSDLGFHIITCNPGHWLLRLHQALPELHFYTEAELAHFARHRARRYAQHYARQNLRRT
ncbi:MULTISPECIES: hypothetical protein [Marinobacter]|uniref:Uncharacterized protein n=1 Tax=Marinobacter profundi TaxID=2666256 RepID=A0A2G1UR67_9GAMM|nr:MULTISPECIES: hypothetical protein [Marinobacter]MBD3656787.1 hypothetical protein [Marinobacter sp.]PHQ17001.1 hypothetical protein CLH61_00065 [Marinobacter profundi]